MTVILYRLIVKLDWLVGAEYRSWKMGKTERETLRLSRLPPRVLLSWLPVSTSKCDVVTIVLCGICAML